MPVYNINPPSVETMVNELSTQGESSLAFNDFKLESAAREPQRNGDVVVTTIYRITARQLAAARNDAPDAVDDLTRP